MINELAQVAQLVKSRNAQELAMSMIQNNQINDPNISQLLTLAQKGDINSMVNIANTLFAQRGMDFNSLFNSFSSLMK